MYTDLKEKLDESQTSCWSFFPSPPSYSGSQTFQHPAQGLQHGHFLTFEVLLLSGKVIFILIIQRKDAKDIKKINMGN